MVVMDARTINVYARPYEQLYELMVRVSITIIGEFL